MTEPTTLHRTAGAISWVVGVAAATAFVLLFTLAGAPTDSAPDPATTTGDAGAAVYAARCAACHGPDGGGGTGPAFEDLTERYPDEGAMVAVVVGGRGVMPAFGATLTAAEIEAVVAHVRERYG